MKPQSAPCELIAEHRRVLDAVEAGLLDAFARLVAVRVDSVRGGHKLLLFGNGGSAADARIGVEDFPAFVVVDDKGNDFFAEFARRAA